MSKYTHLSQQLENTRNYFHYAERYVGPKYIPLFSCYDVAYFGHFLIRSQQPCTPHSQHSFVKAILI